MSSDYYLSITYFSLRIQLHTSSTYVIMSTTHDVNYVVYRLPTLYASLKIEVTPGAAKPRRRMQEKTTLLKTALKSWKELKIDDQFLLKLPNMDSHEYYVTEGEVRYLFQK